MSSFSVDNLEIAAIGDFVDCVKKVARVLALANTCEQEVAPSSFVKPDARLTGQRGITAINDFVGFVEKSCK
jgi:hypothetical protein